MKKDTLKTIDFYGDVFEALYPIVSKKETIKELEEWLEFDTMRVNGIVLEGSKEIDTDKYHRKRLELYKACLYHLTRKKKYKVKKSKTKTIRLADDYYFRINMRHIGLIKHGEENFRILENCGMELSIFGSCLYYLINE